MIISNTTGISGYKIVKTLGLVKGNTIRAEYLGKDKVADLRAIVGREVKEYTKVISDARDLAVDRMIQDAQAIGADAVINVCFCVSPAMQATIEILAYGTAVKIEEREPR